MTTEKEALLETIEQLGEAHGRIAALQTLCAAALELRGLEYDIDKNYKLNPQERGNARLRAMGIEDALRAAVKGETFQLAAQPVTAPDRNSADTF